MENVLQMSLNSRQSVASRTYRRFESTFSLYHAVARCVLVCKHIHNVVMWLRLLCFNVAGPLSGVMGGPTSAYVALARGGFDSDR